MSTTTTELTQEEKRTKIAEACGRVWHPEDQHAVDSQKSGVTAGTPSFGYCIQYCKCGAWKMAADRHWSFDSDKPEAPNYFNSLDAMAEAEGVLPADDCHSGDYLELIGKRSSAPERAEAFGKTLGLWV